MYENGMGPTAIGTGAVILPFTGGNTFLMAIGILLIVVGAVIAVSTVARSVAARAYKKDQK